MLDKVLIIGGGIVGACFAYHAHLRGIKKITVVSSALPGERSQATSNTWGWVNGYASNDKAYAAFRLASVQYWPEFLKNIINLSPTSKGAFFWDQQEAEIIQTIDQHQYWGHAVELMNELEVKKILPNLNILPKRAGYGINDLAIEGVKATKEIFKVSKCEVINQEVSEIIYENNQVTGVKTVSGTIKADEVIIAAGLGSSTLLSTVGVDFKMKSSFGLLAYTNSLPPLLKHPVTGLDFHVRQDDEGRLIIGGKFDDDDISENNITIAATKLVQDMSNKLNYNGHMVLNHYTLGERPLPVDGRPKIGRLKNNLQKEINGLYLAVMHSGITNAPLASKLGIEEIMSGKRDELLEDFLPQKNMDNINNV